MKFFKYIVLVLAVGLFSTSCKDYFNEFNNEDPDNPIVVSPNVILPQVQLRLAYTWGGDFTRYIGLNTQHVTGVSRQFAVLGQYGITPSDVDAAWSNIYTGTLQSNRELRDQSIALGNGHYEGIARAIEAYTMMLATDMWGDLPYSDAFNFAENGGVYQPVFDSQEQIYNQIFNELDLARNLFNGDAGGNAPGGDDFFYGGDVSQWIKFCNVLEARGRLHLVKRSNNDYQSVLDALNKGSFTGLADDAGQMFGTAATENAPWFQYVEQRDDCETGTTYKATLADLVDPRDATYGWPHDNDHPIWTKDQFVVLLGYTEQEFIRAEAELMANGPSQAAYDAYLAAIEASFTEAQVPDEYENYIAQPAVGVGADNLTLENIITQKWIALYTNPEVFSDWRRTGYPALTPVTGTEIPRKLPIAQTEIFSNPDNIPSVEDQSIFARVWWDAE